MKRLMLLGLGCLTLTVGFALVGITDLVGQIPDRRKVPEWIATLKDPKAGSSAKIEAAKDLGRLGMVRASDSKPAIPILLDIMAKDKDAPLRIQAAVSLGQIASEAETVVPALVKLLNDDKEPFNIRAGAATGLGYMGNDAKEAVSDLRSIQQKYKTKDKDKRAEMALSKAAGDALKKINPKKK
jgi:hypothetical protein